MEVERNLQDAMQVTRNVMLNPSLLPGGGAVEMAVAQVGAGDVMHRRVINSVDNPCEGGSCQRLVRRRGEIFVYNPVLRFSSSTVMGSTPLLGGCEHAVENPLGANGGGTRRRLRLLSVWCNLSRLAAIVIKQNFTYVTGKTKDSDSASRQTQ